MAVVLVEQQSPHVTRLILNRPDRRNALSIELMNELVGAIEQAGANESMRMLILQGNGPVFCAGLDLNETGDRTKSHESAEAVARTLLAISESRLVTIAAVHGAALAGGAGIMSACDFAIAAEGTKFGYPEVRRGLVAGLVMTFLRRQLGERHIRELLLEAEPIDAARAEAIGLVSRVVPADDLDTAVQQLIDRLSQGAPGAVQRSKRLLEELWPTSVRQDVERALRYHMEARESPEAVEGVAAYLEKRAPRWREVFATPEETREEKKPTGERITPQPIRKSAKQIWQEKISGPPEAGKEEPAAEIAAAEQGGARTTPRPRRPDTPAGETGKAKVPPVLLAPAPGGAVERARHSAIITIAILLGALLLLAGVFYVGTKFNYWRYRLMTKFNKPELAVADKYPNASVEELIEQAFAAERARNWTEAVDKFVAAKKKNLALKGVLYRVGRIAFNSGDLVSADAAFERAITFGEDLDKANFSRGIIAMRRTDYPAAQRFFAAAAAAEPLTAEYHYFAGEAARLAQKPREAIPHYRDAAERSTTQQDVLVCEFKIDIARIEAGEGGKVALEIQTEKAEGQPSIFNVLAESALNLQQGKIEEALKLLVQARDMDQPRLFRAGVNDLLFKNAAEKSPHLAELIRPATPAAAGQPAPAATEATVELGTLLESSPSPSP